ncbi:uroporphyrinogen-III synthase [Parasedimentitalea maritima]|uniref:Uroporphyrinogen-III synthase n=2 Tax=Parasedimentitalea maritima TaxID=2578117 RepID=A0ABY2UXU2_9RHOB|nr:uroporphyrinogen-III synthase [Zongyanglinia marina]
MVGLLMTRPYDAAQRFVSELPAALIGDLEVIYSPLLKVQPLNETIDLEGFSAVVFTSSNGVSVAARSLGRVSLRAYCLGERTTLAAEKAGWQSQFCGMTADDLVSDLLKRRPSGRMLHLRGQHSRGDVAARLSEAGLDCREQVIYDQLVLPLTNEASTALSLSRDLVVPLFSPRTARQFADLCPQGAPIHLIAMSDAVANHLKLLKYKDLKICMNPEALSMQRSVRQVAEQLVRVESGGLAQ